MLRDEGDVVAIGFCRQLAFRYIVAVAFFEAFCEAGQDGMSAGGGREGGGVEGRERERREARGERVRGGKERVEEEA